MVHIASGKTDCAITLRTAQKDRSSILEVADTGCGMDADVLGKIFNVFFSTKGIHGTGLGLSVTRKIILEHGGDLEVESEPGAGSVFRVVLPHPPAQQTNIDAERSYSDAKENTGC